MRRVQVTEESAARNRARTRAPHPVGSVNGGQGVQVSHGELQAALPQVVVHVHHAAQRGGAAEGVGPRLQGGTREQRMVGTFGGRAPEA